MPMKRLFPLLSGWISLKSIDDEVTVFFCEPFRLFPPTKRAGVCRAREEYRLIPVQKRIVPGFAYRGIRNVFSVVEQTI